MKLRLSFPSQKLIFASGVAFGFCLISAFSAAAQDKITTKQPAQTQDVKILDVTGGTVRVQMAAGTIGIPVANIASITMATPAEFDAAIAANKAKDYAKALDALKPLVAKFKGLPTPWAQQATSLLGDVYVSLNKLPEAEAAYQDFQKNYGGQGSAQTAVGLARIAFSKKSFDAARQKLDPIIQQALKEKSPNPALAITYSQAFCLLGQINEADGKYQEALQNYLLTTTLFYHDSAAASAAQEKADALRKERNTTVQ